MATTLDKTLDIDFANRLLAYNRDTLGLRYIPLRWKLLQQHWGKGHLVGTRGGYLLVRPLSATHGNRLEDIPPNKAKLWTSKMTREQLNMVDLLSKKNNLISKDFTKEIVMSESDSDSVQSSVLSDQDNRLDNLFNSVSNDSVNDSLTVKVSASVPSKNINFADKMSLFKSVRDELLSLAHSGGLGYLQNLRKDYDEYVQMVELARLELLDAINIMENAGISIPDNILAGIKDVIKVDSVTPKVDTPKADISSGKIVQLKMRRQRRHAHWATARAREHKDKIVSLLSSNINKKWSGREIMTLLDINEPKPSRILGVLVNDGVIGSIGNRVNMRYFKK